MRLSTLYLAVICCALRGAGPAAAQATAQTWAPWSSAEATNLYAQAKADFAAQNYDAVIAEADRYLDLAAPTARVHGLLGQAYFKKELYALAQEHLQTAISLARAHGEPVRQVWIDVLRRSGGTVDDPPERPTAAPARATTPVIPRDSQSADDDAACRRTGAVQGSSAYVRCRNDITARRQLQPEQRGAIAQAQIIYQIEAERAQAQGEVLSQIHAAQAEVGAARAQAATPMHNDELGAIARERINAQSEALEQLHAAQSEAGRARAQAAPPSQGYDLQAEDAERQAAQRDALAQLHAVDSEKGFDRIQSGQ